MKLRLFALLFVFPAALAAQVRQDTLPRLSPQEVEIRGELRVSFPSIARSPLTGFAAGPRLKEIPADRKPFLPPYRQTDLPPSPLSRPTPPALRILPAAAPRRGLLEAGAGTFFSRFGRFYLDAPASPVTSLYASARYEGSDGHRVEQDANSVRAPFDLAEGTLGLRSGGRLLSVDGRVGGFYRSYTLYGAEVDGQLSTARMEPAREGFGGHATLDLGLHPRPETSVEARLSYQASAYDTGLYGRVRQQESRSEIDETRLEGRLGFTQRLGTNFFEVGATGGSAGLDGGGTPGTDQVYADAGGAYTLVGPTLRLRAGVRLLATRAEHATGTARANYIAPDVSVQVVVAQGVEAYAQNLPHIAPNALPELFEQAPYLVQRPVVRPTALPINVEGGVRAAVGDVQLKAWAGFLRAHRMQYFVQRAEAGYRDGAFVEAAYKEGRVINVGGEVRLLRVEGIQAAVGAQYRNSELTETIEPIPYVPAAQAWATAGYVLPGGKLVAELKGTLEGVRYADLDAQVRVPAYADLDASLQYALTPSIIAVARLDNLLPGNRTWWRGYPEAPFTAMVGLSIRW